MSPSSPLKCGKNVQVPYIIVILTSGHYPQSNGQVECLSQEITQFLCAYCGQHQEDWSRFLAWAEYTQNFLKMVATGLLPFQSVQEIESLFFPWAGEPTELPLVDEWLSHL